jgi:ABC-type uncharacterized transport system involved in gliding motility auxiliary subunit
VSLVKKNVGWLGVLCLLGAGALTVFVPWLTRLRWILVIAGAVLLLASLLLNAREAQGVLGRRGTRYGASAAVMVLLALGVVVFANALSSRHSVRWDFTENRRNTLSPQTVQVLKTLKTPVEAIAFFRTDTPGKRTAEDLLGQYAAQSGGKFTWRLEDTDKAPGLAREYGVESYGTVVIKGGGPDAARTEKLLDAEEEKLTNALVKVTRSGKRTVYVIKGHGEREVTNTERAGFSQARDQMDKANYEVKELLLAQQAKVPDDAAVVIVPGPKTDLFPQEVAALDAYIARGGKALFMATPFQAEGLRTYLEKYGIVLHDDVVIELNPIGQLFGTGPLVPIVSQYDQHPITKDLAGVMTLFPLTRSVEAVKSPPKGTAIQPLAKTSAQSWGETDKSVFSKGQANPDPGEKTGPLAVAVVVTVDVEGKPDAKAEWAEPKKPVKARIVVVGTADFASNQFLGAQGNKDFFLNVVSWLAEEEDLLSVRPKDTKQNPIVLTSAQSNLVLWLPLAILPGAVVICGMMVTARRRRTS